MQHFFRIQYSCFEHLQSTYPERLQEYVIKTSLTLELHFPDTCNKTLIPQPHNLETGRLAFCSYSHCLKT